MELQREVTLVKLALSPYILIKSISPVDINMFARFDEVPTMTLQDIKVTKRYGQTDRRTDVQTHRQHENGITPQQFPGVQWSFNGQFCLYMYASIHMTVTAVDFS